MRLAPVTTKAESIMEHTNPSDARADINTVISDDGTEIAHKQTGTGPPLALVHGSGVSDHRRWDISGLRSALAEQVTIYAVDRRGRATAVMPRHIHSRGRSRTSSPLWNRSMNP